MVESRWDTEQWAVDLVPYVVLLRAFVERRLSGLEFESLFLGLFKNDQMVRPEEIYEVLDALFADVDSFCSDPELRAEVGGLDEDQLRRRVGTALDRLGVLGREQ